jgi:acyl-CoA thioesterase I
MARGRSHRHARGQRAFAVLVAVALIAGLVGYQVYERHARTRQLLAFNCATLTRLTESTADERKLLFAQASGPTVIFLGDSYTQGVGLTNIRDDYAYVAATALRWRPVLNGAGGTGYVNGGPCHGQQFAARVRQVVPARPTFLVVQGGLNDYRSSHTEIADAARQLYAHLRRQLPATRVVVVGPHPVPKVHDVSPVIDALREAAAGAHVAYIDTSAWPLSFEKDGIHLTVAGHQAFGRKLAEAISAANIS